MGIIELADSRTGVQESGTPGRANAIAKNRGDRRMDTALVLKFVQAQIKMFKERILNTKTEAIHNALENLLYKIGLFEVLL